jgi:hypothetical protein
MQCVATCHLCLRQPRWPTTGQLPMWYMWPKTFGLSESESITKKKTGRDGRWDIQCNQHTYKNHQHKNKHFKIIEINLNFKIADSSCLYSDHMSTNSDESAEESGSVSPPDFSSKLCESIVHDHLSSTCLSTPFTTPGVKQRVRKVSYRNLWAVGFSVNALFL